MKQQEDHAHLAAWKCWTVALIATTAATTIEMLLLRTGSKCAFLPPIAAVVVTGCIAGLRPSLLTFALNLLIAEYLVLPAQYSFALLWISGAKTLVTLIAFASLSWYSALCPVAQQTVRSVSHISRSKIRKLVKATTTDRART
jgi:hypothetical protein